MTFETQALTQVSLGEKKYFFGPFIDFLCLGGITIFLLPFLFWAPPAAVISGSLIFIVSNYFFNDSHFLSTYQIYYRDFRRKAFHSDLSHVFRLRYLFAGVVFPAALVGFAVFGALRPDTTMIAYMSNLLIFLVGWHYVKQGYGILIIDSVYKKRFLTNFEKAVFRYNGLAWWLYFWMLVNYLVPIAGQGKIIHTNFHFSQIVLGGTGFAAVLTTLAVLFVIARRIFRRQKLPVTGVVIYFITVYVWQLGFFDLVTRLIVPALHSIQYHAVVWRYKINRESADTNAKLSLGWRLALFGAFSLLLGYLGFTGVPNVLDKSVDYNHAIFGAALFVFIFQTFLNVHHFVMDGVIWHHSNPEMATYLFNKPVARQNEPAKNP